MLEVSLHNSDFMKKSLIYYKYGIYLTDKKTSLEIFENFLRDLSVVVDCR